MAFPEAPELFHEDDTTLMIGVVIDGQIRHVMRLSVPALKEGETMPFLLRDLVASGQDLSEDDLRAHYGRQAIDLATSVSVESNVRAGDREEAIASADLAYLAVFEIMRRVGAGAVFAHLNDAARTSFTRVGLQGRDVVDRADLRTPGTEPGQFDERYRPVCLPADAHNVGVMQSLASVTPAVMWSPAPPPWWDASARSTGEADIDLRAAPPSSPGIGSSGSGGAIDLPAPVGAVAVATERGEATATSTSDGAGLHITVRLATGTGPTSLAAFDDALRQAAVADRNLLRLSSIIPPGATVQRSEAPTSSSCPGEWGDRLYVVMAEERVERRHEEAWAGIAWRQDPSTGAGLFVEHHGHSQHQVETDLLSTVNALAVGRPGIEWGDPEVALTGVVCEDQPVCALAVAVFKAEPWLPGDVIDLRDD